MKRTLAGKRWSILNQEKINQQERKRQSTKRWEEYQKEWEEKVRKKNPKYGSDRRRLHRLLKEGYIGKDATEKVLMEDIRILKERIKVMIKREQRIGYN